MWEAGDSLDADFGTNGQALPGQTRAGGGEESHTKPADHGHNVHWKVSEVLQ